MLYKIKTFFYLLILRLGYINLQLWIAILVTFYSLLVYIIYFININDFLSYFSNLQEFNLKTSYSYSGYEAYKDIHCSLENEEKKFYIINVNNTFCGEKGTFVPIWEKLFGNGILIKYTTQLNCSTNSDGIIFNEETKIIFKDAFNKERYSHLLEKIRESTEPVRNPSLYFNPQPFSDLNAIDSSSTSVCDSPPRSVITVIPWIPEDHYPTDLPDIIVTTPEGDRFGVDYGNFDGNTDYDFYYSLESVDPLRLNIGYTPALGVNDRVSGWLHTDDNTGDIISDDVDRGWDDYFEKDKEAEKDICIERYGEEFFEIIKDSKTLDKCFRPLMHNDYRVFKPWVLDELYRQYLEDTLDIKDISKVACLTYYCALESYATFEQIDAEEYIKYLKSLDPLNQDLQL